MPRQSLPLQELQGTPTYPMECVALVQKFAAMKVGRVVVVDATCHVDHLVVGVQDEVVNLESLQHVVLVRK